MNQEGFNLEIRRFLKRFGITAQREIEKAVEAALAAGSLTGRETLPVHATVTIPGLLPATTIEGQLDLTAPAPPAT
jgi:uncharacterized protein DUF6494